MPPQGHAGRRQSTFKGEVVGEEYTVWPSHLDSPPNSQGEETPRPVDLVFYPVPPASVPQPYAQGRHQAADPALYRVHRRRIVAAVQKGQRKSAFRRAEWVNDLPNAQNKRFRSKTTQEISGPASDLLRRARPMTPRNEQQRGGRRGGDT